MWLGRALHYAVLNVSQSERNCGLRTCRPWFPGFATNLGKYIFVWVFAFTIKRWADFSSWLCASFLSSPPLSLPFWLFETGICCIVWIGLKLKGILLLLPSWCWDYRYLLSHWVSYCSFRLKSYAIMKIQILSFCTSWYYLL